MPRCSESCLGFLYAAGDGVSQNHVEAARLWKLAAAQGRTDAHFALGALYAEGAAGVARDYAEAAELLRMSAAQDCAEAVDALKELSSGRAYASACCVGCGATRKLKTCAKCEVARFCGAECSRRAWAEHKPHCKRWAAEAHASAGKV
jgi:TPR repeat protein